MTNTPSSGARRIAVECITPILRVNNLQESLRFYVDVLGFVIEWGEQPGSDMASISRDGHSIMLSEGDQGQRGTWVWVGVEDVDPVFQNCRDRGVTVQSPPANYPWAFEMRLEDPDGHVLRIGSEPRT